MREFLDLPGQSGASYRFRLWRQDQPHQPIAGNYVVVKEADGATPEVRVIGVTSDLSRVGASMRKAQRNGPVQVYTRLNVSRAVREAEHQDLVAQHGQARVESGDA